MERMEGTLEYELKDTICYNLRGTLESLRDALGTLDEALHLD